MRYMNFDTETTGLPKSGYPSDHPEHPKNVSITAFVDDAAGNTIAEMCRIVKPDGWRTEDYPEAFAVHGITTERAMAEGIPLADVMDEFAALLEMIDVISSFNLFFDFKMAKIGCAHVGNGIAIRTKLESLQGICTMEAAGLFLTGKKRISLKNAYWELFKERTQTDKHHASRPDALAARRIFWELKKRSGLMVPKSMASRYTNPPPEAEKPPVGTSQEVEL